MDKAILKKTASLLMADYKGILATDATQGTIDKRFKKAGIVPSARVRREFRQVVITTPGLFKFISGVILNDEIIRQKINGASFAALVNENKILPGIKVDEKTQELPNFPGEKITKGLDGLEARLAEYKTMGAKFSKWRAVFTVTKDLPSETCIKANSETMATYASLSQAKGLVPIVEPEVLLGGKHRFGESESANKRVLRGLFEYLLAHKVYLEGLILKTSWVHPGLARKEKLEDEKIAKATVRVLKSEVPTNVGGVVFLSGGDTPTDATGHLNAVNQERSLPWPVGFSFERALEGMAMAAWQAKEKNIAQAQRILYERAKMNSLARMGKYDERIEDAMMN